MFDMKNLDLPLFVMKLVFFAIFWHEIIVKSNLSSFFSSLFILRYIKYCPLMEAMKTIFNEGDLLDMQDFPALWRSNLEKMSLFLHKKMKRKYFKVLDKYCRAADMPLINILKGAKKKKSGSKKSVQF